MEGIKTIKVVNDLELEIRGEIITLSAGMFSRRSIAFTAAELPALLDRLNAAAEAMQIPTKQGALVKACNKLRSRADDSAHTYDNDVHIAESVWNEFEQAIAKAE